MPDGGKITDVSQIAANPNVFSRLLQSARYVIAGVKPGGWMSPGQPIAPVGVEPRQWDYPVGINTTIEPRPENPGIFRTLRGLADGCDLVRLAIETRKDQMEAMEWQIRPREDADAEETDPRVKDITKFFLSPDKVLDWNTWLRQVLEEHFVIDAVTIYKRRDKKGRLFALEQLDGSSIAVKVDDSGRRPLPPDPAYQQIVKGIPATDFTTDELIYYPRNSRVHRVHGFCYDSETEILTRDRGFVKFSDLLPTDFVATRNVSKQFEWQKPTAYINNPYSGQMYHFTSRSMDLLVTPEHRMLVSFSKLSAKYRSERVVSATELADGLNRERKIPVTSEWVGGQEVGDMMFPRTAPSGQDVTISGDDFCALMGAYLAEGNLRSTGGIEIAQREYSKGFHLYRNLVSRINRHEKTGYNGKAFVINYRALTEYFRQFGHAHEKFVPDIIRNATLRQLNIFWEYFTAGDGCYIPSKNRSGRGTHPPVRYSMRTVSPRLADHLVEISQKVGCSASVTKRPAYRGTFNIGGKPYHSDCRESYVLQCRYSEQMSVNSKLTQYTGTVHCVTVPNGIVYVRRNGKPAWCGNSPVEQVEMTINIAIRRQLHQLAYYSDGNLSDGIFWLPPEWTPDQVAAFQKWWDSIHNGNLKNRRQAKMVPGAKDSYQQIVQPPLKDLYDEWLARIVCFAFSISAEALISKMNRATAETSHDAALEQGLAPLQLYIKRLIDRIIAEDFDAPDIEFVWVDDRAIDPKEAMDIDTGYVKSGIKSIDEVRIGLGLDPVGGPAERLAVITATGFSPIPTDEELALQQQAQQASIDAQNVGDNQEAQPGKKGDKAEKLLDASLKKNSLDRPLAKHAESHIRKRALAVLKKTGRSVAAQVLTKLSKDDEESEKKAKKISDNVDLSHLEEMSGIVSDLELVAKDSGQSATADLGITSQDNIFDQVNQRAVQWAQSRAADLVSQIDGTTRDMLRSTIQKGLEDNIGLDKIAKSIEGSYAFSEDRADLIAATEVANANSQGALAGYKEARSIGVKVKKEWLIAAEACPICEANADDGPIDLDDEFSSGDTAPPGHPRCLCALSPVVEA